MTRKFDHFYLPMSVLSIRMVDIQGFDYFKKDFSIQKVSYTEIQKVALSEFKTKKGHISRTIKGCGIYNKENGQMNLHYLKFGSKSIRFGNFGFDNVWN